MGFPLWFTLVCKIAEFWRWKLWDQNFGPFSIQEIYTLRKVNKESKESNTWLYLFYRVENKFYNFQGNLMIFTICFKIRYFGKPETSFNLRLNDHRKGVKKCNAIRACKHFKKHWFDIDTKKHWFDKHAKFILTERIKNIKTTSTETLKIRLKKKENFSIKWLKTLAAIGLNQELN